MLVIPLHYILQWKPFEHKVYIKDAVNARQSEEWFRCWKMSEDDAGIDNIAADNMDENDLTLFKSKKKEKQDKAGATCFREETATTWLLRFI